MQMSLLIGTEGASYKGWGLAFTLVVVSVDPPRIGYRGASNNGAVGFFNLNKPTPWFTVPNDERLAHLHTRRVWIKVEDSDRQSHFKLTFTLKKEDGTDDLSFTRMIEDCDMTDLTSGPFEFSVQLLEI